MLELHSLTWSRSGSVTQHGFVILIIVSQGLLEQLLLLVGMLVLVGDLFMRFCQLEDTVPFAARNITVQLRLAWIGGSASALDRTGADRGRNIVIFQNSRATNKALSLHRGDTLPMNS